MKCVVCTSEFESKRADAKFCSSTCRSKMSRGVATDISSEAPAPPEKEKKEDRLCCSECRTFDENDPSSHWCPSEECGCFQTAEEQKREIEEFQKECTHPVAEIYLARCLRCLGHVMYKKVEKKALLKDLCKKHGGFKYQCGCK